MAHWIKFTEQGMKARENFYGISNLKNLPMSEFTDSLLNGTVSLSIGANSIQLLQPPSTPHQLPRNRITSSQILGSLSRRFLPLRPCLLYWAVDQPKESAIRVNEQMPASFNEYLTPSAADAAVNGSRASVVTEVV